MNRNCHVFATVNTTKYIFYYRFKSFDFQKPLLIRFLSRSLSHQGLRVSFQDGIRRITMCDTKTRNALSIAMMENLIQEITNDKSNPELRVIVLATEDGKVFSAGHNLKELTQESGAERHRKVFETAAKLMRTVIESPVPILARVDGLAAAAGCQLVAQCDLAFCSEKSSFSTPGANFGIFCSTPGVALARSVPKSRALQMLFTGLPISGPEAERCGLVTKCSANLDEDVAQTCTAIKHKSRAVIALGKSFYYEQIRENDVGKAYDLGGDQMVENLGLDDGKEGIVSFVEKRKPQWKN